MYKKTQKFLLLLGNACEDLTSCSHPNTIVHCKKGKWNVTDLLGLDLSSILLVWCAGTAMPTVPSYKNVVKQNIISYNRQQTFLLIFTLHNIESISKIVDFSMKISQTLSNQFPPTYQV